MITDRWKYVITTKESQFHPKQTWPIFAPRSSIIVFVRFWLFFLFRFRSGRKLSMLIPTTSSILTITSITFNTNEYYNPTLRQPQFPEQPWVQLQLIIFSNSSKAAVSASHSAIASSMLLCSFMCWRTWCQIFFKTMVLVPYVVIGSDWIDKGRWFISMIP